MENTNENKQVSDNEIENSKTKESFDNAKTDKKESLFSKIKKAENLIGILLMLPIYMIVLVLLVELHLSEDNTILAPILMYIPILVGIIMTYVHFPKKASSILSGIILFMSGFSVYFYYLTYGVDYSGWDGLGYYLLWLGTTVVTRIFSCIYYGKLVGVKKTLKFFGLYVIAIVLSVVFGFWA